MASVSGPGVSVQYQYDADGRRVKEVSGGATKQYLIDRLLPYGQVVVETNGSGNLNAEYVYGLERVSQERGGVRSYYLADGQGSIRQMTDSVGNVTDTYDYTAFGEALASTGTTVNEFRYVGEQLDGNSGFYYNRARWYDGGTGRFASVDPYTGQSTNPISLHRYLYANASPVSFTDPTGRWSLAEVVASIGIGLAIGNIIYGHSKGIPEYLYTRIDRRTDRFTINLGPLFQAGVGIGLGSAVATVKELTPSDGSNIMPYRTARYMVYLVGGGIGLDIGDDFEWNFETDGTKLNARDFQGVGSLISVGASTPVWGYKAGTEIILPISSKKYFFNKGGWGMDDPTEKVGLDAISYFAIWRFQDELE